MNLLAEVSAKEIIPSLFIPFKVQIGPHASYSRAESI